MTDAERFFIAEAIRHARALSLTDAISFLTGMLSALAEKHPARAQVSVALDHLQSGDAQLELIATGQLRMEELLKS